MDDFAQVEAAERADALKETAARKGISVVIVEKDFWVCWTLKHLFGSRGDESAMLFKGGTSLSKAFGIIERFSEDIDVSLDREKLGFVDARDPAKATSSKKREALLKELRATTDEYVQSELAGQLETDFSRVLGGHGWIAADATDPQTLHFTYPPSLETQDYGGFSYLKPTVRLEFGARGEHWPAAVQTVTPYVADAFPALFGEPKAQVRTLDAQRTFWEKATILHREFHRKKSPATADRISRHYYDLAKLAESPLRDDALKRADLLAAVAKHNLVFFRAGWAKYDEAKPGTLRLVPHEALEHSLRSDYSKMREMIFGDPPEFDTVLATLRDLENETNSLSQISHK